MQKLESEIKRFGWLLKLISWLEPIFICIPIWLTARLFCLSSCFTNAMLYPLTTLFFRHSQTKFYFNQSTRKVTLTNVYTDSDQFNGSFDFIIFACDAETVLKIFENPSKIQQAVLGNIRYFDDVTYTHTDLDYMKTHYNVHLEFDQYFIHSNMKDSRQPLEMPLESIESPTTSNCIKT
ncbi:unnamed protein product [Rotaria socialis]|uniref:Uncharacterized protein n=1 Tax=Rotaria socialis TaxID=392032 RepID=A0A820D4Z8_9BILA|nr:unnamed protein product [Rotaria socialis]